ncbi:MAG TPA: hypothetical protein VKZ81_20385 [Pseudonocardia sp.]|uniref:hypothetical protein n=1 Tax=Pseudonocardia sp. TaxID=60912 RepID=UPI002B4B0DA3|nr:hypothetical protein [Pseudonocardia sp.]HLU57822.1 hypothetical protein [Pseudonocardia sp.]
MHRGPPGLAPDVDPDAPAAAARERAARRSAAVITGFALVCLNVLDLDEAERFSVDVLGSEVGIE